MATDPDRAARCQQPVAAGPADDKDPTSWPASHLAAIETILDRSLVSAGPAVRDTFDRAERQMSAIEFVTFWNTSRMKAMATVGSQAVPHIAPVHAEFAAGRLRTTIYENAVRRRDLPRALRRLFVFRPGQAHCQADGPRSHSHR